MVHTRLLTSRKPSSGCLTRFAWDLLPFNRSPQPGVSSRFP